MAKQAAEIAQVINDDFSEYRQRVAKTRAKAGKGRDSGPDKDLGRGAGDDFIFGDEESAEIVNPIGERGSEGPGRRNGREPRRLRPDVQPAGDEAPKQGKTAGEASATQRRPHGGFSIDFRKMGELENRAKYHRDDRQIVINLDHPQFVAALGSFTIEDLTFRRLAFEVAFSEYALALALELAQRNEYRDVTDPIVDIGDTLNRVARRAAALYQAA